MCFTFAIINSAKANRSKLVVLFSIFPTLRLVDYEWDIQCFHNGECCSGACHNSFCKTEIKLGTPESELTRPSVANGPYVQVNNLDDLITRFGGGSDSTGSASLRQHQSLLIGARSTAGKQCAVVGEGVSSLVV